MYHKALSIKDLSFILDNTLSNHAKITKTIVGAFDPTERTCGTTFFTTGYPLRPLDVSMFENTVCGDCGMEIHGGRCMCEDRTMSMDMRYKISFVEMFGDVTYTVQSRDGKEVYEFMVYGDGSCQCKNIFSEENLFELIMAILRNAEYITDKLYYVTDFEREVEDMAEAADLHIGGGM